MTQVLVNGLSSDTLVFTASNWQTAQTVTVTAVDDDVLEFDHSESIAHTVVTNDPAYQGVPAGSVLVTIADNECGVWPNYAVDYNQDCTVNLEDFAYFAGHWLYCTLPSQVGCDDLR